MKNKANQIIYCCGCQKDIEAELTTGQAVYPKANEELQQHLWHLPFWRCPKCKNFVGCHHKTKNPTNPLGCIPTEEIKNARKYIHKIIDALWKNHAEPFRARGWVYRWLAHKLGKEQYHTAEIRSIEEAREIYKLASTIKKVEDCRNVGRNEN